MPTSQDSKGLLQPAYGLTSFASSSNYATLGMQPLIYESLENHCIETISGNGLTRFTTALAKQAAEAMLQKLNKYKDIMNSPLARTCCHVGSSNT